MRKLDLFGHFVWSNLSQANRVLWATTALVRMIATELQGRNGTAKRFIQTKLSHALCVPRVGSMQMRVEAVLRVAQSVQTGISHHGRSKML